MKTWIVRGGYGLWVVRAANAEEACEVAFSGPAPDGNTTMDEYGIERQEAEAYEITPDGAPQIIDHYFG